AQGHRLLYGLVALGFRPLLDHPPGFLDGIEVAAVDPLACRNGRFAELGHDGYSLTSMPMDRAEPSTMRMAASMLSQFKSFIFFSAISLTCALLTVPATSRPGVFDPLSSFAAFLMKYDTGGVRISKLKQRSW